MLIAANLLALGIPHAAADEPADNFRDALPDRAVIRIANASEGHHTNESTKHALARLRSGSD